MENDLDALLGDGFTESLKKEAENTSLMKTPCGELEVLETPVAPIPIDKLKEHVITQGADMLTKANETISSIMQDIRQIPTDAQALQGAATLLNSYTALLNQFSKTNEMYEKMKHQKEMLAMKLCADKSMADSANETALTMTREQAIQAAIERSERERAAKENGAAGSGV